MRNFSWETDGDYVEENKIKHLKKKKKELFSWEWKLYLLYFSHTGPINNLYELSQKLKHIWK